MAVWFLIPGTRGPQVLSLSPLALSLGLSALPARAAPTWYLLWPELLLTLQLHPRDAQRAVQVQWVGEDAAVHDSTTAELWQTGRVAAPGKNKLSPLTSSCIF